MPPTPKKRLARARTHSRKSTWRLPPLALVPCPKCGTPRLAHHVCPVCGTYRGEQVIEVKEKKKKEQPAG